MKWCFQTGNDIYYDKSLAIGSDGTVYMVASDTIYAVNPDGSLKWDFQAGDNIDSSLAIGADGTVYIGSGDGKLYALGDDHFSSSKSIIIPQYPEWYLQGLWLIGYWPSLNQQQPLQTGYWPSFDQYLPIQSIFIPYQDWASFAQPSWSYFQSNGFLMSYPQQIFFNWQQQPWNPSNLIWQYWML